VVAAPFVGWLGRVYPYSCEFESPPARLGHIQAAWTGYIANRDELDRIFPPGQSASHTDGERFCAAYERWGPLLQRHVLGEYAVAVYNQQTRSLLLTHDALGIRPVFYQQTPDKIVFSSHLAALANGPDGHHISESYVGEYMALGRVTPPLTIYESVYRLPPGFSLSCREDRPPLLSQTWSFQLIPSRSQSTEGERDEEFRDLVTKAVSGARGEKTWCELSGGLDSTSVLWAATECRLPHLQTISFIYPNTRSADERQWIEPAVRHFKVQPHFLDGDFYQPFSGIGDQTVPVPMTTILAWPLFTAYRELVASNNVDVVLTGIGGDNVLYGPPATPSHLPDWLLRGRISATLSELRTWMSLRADQRSLMHRFATDIGNPIWRHLRGLPIIDHRPKGHRCDWLHPDFARRTKVNLRNGTAPAPRLPSIRNQYFHERIWLLTTELDRSWNQILHGCELRSPLLYRPLVEFMFSLPWNDTSRGDQDRVLQRRALAECLPEEVVRRKIKAGTSEIMARGLLENRAAYRLLTDNPLIAQMGFVDQRAWSGVVSKARFGLLHALPSFLATASLEFWLRQRVAN
jgi:asparagine synthase (glutamine-hydrolysing)